MDFEKAGYLQRVRQPFQKIINDEHVKLIAC